MSRTGVDSHTLYGRTVPCGAGDALAAGGPASLLRSYYAGGSAYTANIDSGDSRALYHRILTALSTAFTYTGNAASLKFRVAQVGDGEYIVIWAYASEKALYAQYVAPYVMAQYTEDEVLAMNQKASDIISLARDTSIAALHGK